MPAAAARCPYAFTTGTVGTAIKTDVFTYDDANWKDKLTAFNDQTITYDAIGNPTNDSTWNYSWINGRRLRCMHKGELGEQNYDEITFEYNENGLRTKKTRMYYDNATGDIVCKVTNYTLHGKNIVHMTEIGNELHFFYDVQNKPAVVVFNGTSYAYLYNLQGDVIGLVDSNGTKMVSYSYDAWGKPISKAGTLASTLGTIQPFRYRGYVFDEKTGLYYLQTRYYMAQRNRFVNADTVLGCMGYPLTHNIFTYCVNAPVVRTDDTGMISVWDILVNRVRNAVMIVQHSNATRSNPNPEAEVVTVDVLISNLKIMADKKTDVSAAKDTGCAMYIRAAIVGKLKRHGHHTYAAGMTSMFRDNMVFKGNIEDIGGPSGLVRGMIVGTASTTPGKVSHGGVYYGLYDFGDGPEHAVYSFNTKKKCGNLRPFSDLEWVYYGWHQGVVLDEQE